MNIRVERDWSFPQEKYPDEPKGRKDRFTGWLKSVVANCKETQKVTVYDSDGCTNTTEPLFKFRDDDGWETVEFQKHKGRLRAVVIFDLGIASDDGCSGGCVEYGENCFKDGVDYWEQEHPLKEYPYCDCEQCVGGLLYVDNYVDGKHIKRLRDKENADRKASKQINKEA
jgi:hypothetical protein